MASDSHLPKWLRGLTHEQRRQERRYLAVSVKLARRFSRGFEPADGFDLREIDRIHPSRIFQVKRVAKELREEMGSPHVIVRPPKRRDSLRALRVHTRQRIEVGERGKKLVIVQVAHEQSRVRVRRGRVIEERVVRPDLTVREAYLYLPRAMGSFDEIRRWVIKEKKRWPDGFYGIVNSQHGVLSGTHQRDQWPGRLREQFMVYDEGDAHLVFAESIIGFKLIATSIEGLDRYVRERRTQREIARERAEERMAEEFKYARRRLTRGELLTGRLGRVR